MTHMNNILFGPYTTGTIIIRLYAERLKDRKSLETLEITKTKSTTLRNTIFFDGKRQNTNNIYHY